MSTTEIIRTSRKGSLGNTVKYTTNNTNNNIIIKNGINDYQIDSEKRDGKKLTKRSASVGNENTNNKKKLAKITNNNSNYLNDRLTSPTRQKQLQLHQQHIENPIKKIQQPQQQHITIKEQEKLIKQQQKQQQQQQQQRQLQNNVWIDRKTNKIIYNSHCNDLDEEARQFNIKRSIVSGDINKIENNKEKLSSNKLRASSKPQQNLSKTPGAILEAAASVRSSNDHKINKIMMSEKRNSIPSSSTTTTATNESSSNPTTRCIRNNSYLNANHALILPTQIVVNGSANLNNNAQNLQINNNAFRPSSSTSNSSTSSKITSNKRSKLNSQTNLNNHIVNNGNNLINHLGSNHHINQLQLEIINEKNSFVSNNNNNNINNNNNNCVTLTDYASYEITV